MLMSESELVKEPLNLDGIMNIFYGYIVYSILIGRVSEVIIYIGIAMSGTSLIKGKIYNSALL